MLYLPRLSTLHYRSCVYTDTPTPEPELETKVKDTVYCERLLGDEDFNIYIRVKKPHKNKNKPQAEDSGVRSAVKRELEDSSDEEIIISYDGGSKPAGLINVKGDKKESKKDKQPAYKAGSVEKLEDLDDNKLPDMLNVEDKRDTLTTKEGRSGRRNDSRGGGKTEKDAKKRNQSDEENAKEITGKKTSDNREKQGNYKAGNKRQANDKQGGGEEGPISKRDEEAKNEIRVDEKDEPKKSGRSSGKKSTTEVRALLYEPPQNSFGRIFRAMPQRRFSGGLQSSVLDSITSSSVNLARSLFSRYRSVRDDSEDEALSQQPSSP
ncbi:hypothetical protein HPB51_005674 [Rhipicephalus microplus]|uniref:Uncharacterized protein n=1 Tax=Rhipicephalus microplus TaxID=6941 RepID=A0A9J6EZC1_RHIMP|nr:hypothetical protein HPB51_005674 [Rhipicephalus microplus]